MRRWSLWSIGLLAVAAAVAARAQTPAPPPIHGSAPSISPDGTKIAFLSERDGATDVFVIASDGTGEVRLTRTPEEESQPGWSADGTRIWFTVFADGASRIYSIGLDGADRKLLGTVPGPGDAECRPMARPSSTGPAAGPR